MRKAIFRRRSGEGAPMILAIVLVLLMLFCAVAEFCRLWIIAQGVKEAAQQAVISTVNDNYDDVYHAVREGYAAGLSVELENNGLSSGQSEGYTAVVEIHLEVPVRFLGNLLPSANMTLHTEAKYIPLF